MLYRIDRPEEAIREIQRYLLEIAYAPGGDYLPRVTVDGIYGDRTREAVTRFRRRYGLGEGDRVDPETFALLYAQYRRYFSDRTRHLALRDPTAYPLSLGDRGHAVIVLQSTLNELSEFYPDLGRHAITGLYRQQTAAAVRQMQRHLNLPVTGVTDDKTALAVEEDLRTKSILFAQTQ